MTCSPEFPVGELPAVQGSRRVSKADVLLSQSLGRMFSRRAAGLLDSMTALLFLAGKWCDG